MQIASTTVSLQASFGIFHVPSPTAGIFGEVLGCRRVRGGTIASASVLDDVAFRLQTTGGKTLTSTDPQMIKHA